MNPLIGHTAIRAAAAALLSVVATAAMAQTGSSPSYGCPLSQASNTTCINGGGSTLAANVYEFETTPQNSIFGTVATKTGGTLGISYEKAGSGAGQLAFESNNPFNFGNGDANNAFVVHFGASDAYINSSSPFYPYVGAGQSLPVSGGPFIQIPMLATPITIPIANAKVTADGAGAKVIKGSVALTDADLCGIFSGMITQWGDTSAKARLKKGTIHVYWRADNGGSGTTFLLTQHLAAVCNTSNTEPGFKFSATTKLATLFAGVNGASTNNPPSGSTLWVINPGNDGYAGNFVAAKGSNGVADGVLTDSTDSAIGYVSPDYTSIAKTPATSDISIPYSKLLVADVKNASDGIGYAPDIVSLLSAMQNPGPTAINGTPPALTTANKANAANQLLWVPQIAMPAHGYPIMGYTNLLVAQCYKSTTVANGIKSMITEDLSAASKTLLNNNGFQATIGGTASGWGKAILNAFVSNSVGLDLDVGDKKVCAAYTGR